MVNSLKLGSPFGGSWREISTNAPVCWLMDFTFSPPLPITSPHLWAGMEKVISPPGGPQLPWPLPRPRPPGGIPEPGGPEGPCGGNGSRQVQLLMCSGPTRRLGWGLTPWPPSSLARILCSRSVMMEAACWHWSGGPIIWAIFSGPVPSSETHF